MELLEKEGLRLKTERGNRVFPESDKSSDVIKTLREALKRRGVEILYDTTVSDVETEDGHFKAVTVLKENKQKKVIEGDAVIIATGGLSYPTTGSTGDGYRFAELLPLIVFSSMMRLAIFAMPSAVALRINSLTWSYTRQ